MRAITPIIAVILLVLLTISAAGAAFLWLQVIQSQFAEGTQEGLDTSMLEMHGQMTLESVFNKTGGQLCMIVRNSGSVKYPPSLIRKFAVYVDGDPYLINTTTLTADSNPGDQLLLCLCTEAEVPNVNCAGPLPQGYTYTGDRIDITLELPVGTGDMRADFQPSG